MHQVTFKGADRTLEADEHETVLSVAQRNGLHIDSSCGGNGSCHQCRILVHEGRENLERHGHPIVARHKQGDKPVFLACQCEIRGAAVVEPAPVNAVGASVAQSSLLGWSAAGDVQKGAPLAVYDPGLDTGGAYFVDDEGNFTHEKGYARLITTSTEDAPLSPGHRAIVIVGGQHSVSDAMLAGVSHLGEPMVLDLLGRCCTKERRVRFDVSPMLKGVALHLPGAIQHVEWSPLKTRTVIGTVGNRAPTGLSLSGLLSGISALMQAGMCTRGLELTESRFTTRDSQGDLQAVIVGPNDEAQTVHGVVHRSLFDITITQHQLDLVKSAARLMHAAIRKVMPTGYDGPLVVTGDFGTFAPAELIWGLNLWDGQLEFVPHAAALGAARLAFRQR